MTNRSDLAHRFWIRLASLLVAEVFFCSLFFPSPALPLERFSSSPEKDFLRQRPTKEGSALREIEKDVFSRDGGVHFTLRDVALMLLHDFGQHLIRRKEGKHRETTIYADDVLLSELKRRFGVEAVSEFELARHLREEYGVEGGHRFYSEIHHTIEAAENLKSLVWKHKDTLGKSEEPNPEHQEISEAARIVYDYLIMLSEADIGDQAKDGAERILPDTIAERLRKPFRLMIVDLDDSLLLGKPPEGSRAFEPETKVLFSQLRTQEVDIAAITGRSLPGVTERYIRELSYPERAGQFVFVAGGGRGFRFDAEGYLDEQAPVFVKPLLEDPAALSRLHREVERIAVQIVEESGQSRELVHTHFEDGHPEDPVKLTVDMPDVSQMLRNRVADVLNRHFAGNPVYQGIRAYATSLAVEVTRADKGDAVRHIVESLGIPEVDILLVGDSAIDGPMYAALEHATKLHLGDPFPGMPEDVIVSPISNTAGIRAAMAIVLEARARGIRLDATAALHRLNDPSIVVTFDNPEIEYAFGHMSDLQRQMAVTSGAWEIREMAKGRLRVSLPKSSPEAPEAEEPVEISSRILDVQEALHQLRTGSVKPSPRWRRGFAQMSRSDIEQAIVEGAVQVVERRPGIFFLTRPSRMPYGVLTAAQTLGVWRRAGVQKSFAAEANIERMKPDDVEEGIRNERIRAMWIGSNRIFVYPARYAELSGEERPMPESSEDGGAKKDTLINDLWHSIRTQNQKRLEKLLERLRRRADTWVWDVPAGDKTPLGKIPEEIQNLAVQLGLDLEKAKDVALASSELIGDVIFHTKGGVFVFRKIQRQGRTALEMIALDRGPGIPEGEAVFKKELNPDLLAIGGRGFFILNALKEEGQLDDIRIDSKVQGIHPDPGTKISILKWLNDTPKETAEDGGRRYSSEFLDFLWTQKGDLITSVFVNQYQQKLLDENGEHLLLSSVFLAYLEKEGLATKKVREAIRLIIEQKQVRPQDLFYVLEQVEREMAAQDPFRIMKTRNFIDGPFRRFILEISNHPNPKERMQALIDEAKQPSLDVDGRGLGRLLETLIWKLTPEHLANDPGTVTFLISLVNVLYFIPRGLYLLDRNLGRVGHPHSPEDLVILKVVSVDRRKVGGEYFQKIVVDSGEMTLTHFPAAFSPYFTNHVILHRPVLRHSANRTHAFLSGKRPYELSFSAPKRWNGAESRFVAVANGILKGIPGGSPGVAALLTEKEEISWEHEIIHKIIELGLVEGLEKYVRNPQQELFTYPWELTRPRALIRLIGLFATLLEPANHNDVGYPSIYQNAKDLLSLAFQNRIGMRDYSRTDLQDPDNAARALRALALPPEPTSDELGRLLSQEKPPSAEAIESRIRSLNRVLLALPGRSKALFDFMNQYVSEKEAASAPNLEKAKDGGRQATTLFRLKDYFYQGQAAVLNGSI